MSCNGGSCGGGGGMKFNWKLSIIISLALFLLLSGIRLAVIYSSNDDYSGGYYD